MNTVIRQRKTDGGEFENVIDAPPEDVQAELDRVASHGKLQIRDRSGKNLLEVWTSSLVSFEATHRPVDPIPMCVGWRGS